MHTASKPTLFIGSSTEGIKYANALFAELESVSQAVVWDQDLFAPSKSTLEELERLSHQYDFAALVLSADDDYAKRGIQSKCARDNVLFEAGLFIGSIGRERVFLISPRYFDIAIPSDLLGLGLLHFDGSRDDGDYRFAVRTCATTLKVHIQNVSKRSIEPAPVRFWQTIAERQRVDLDVRGLIAGAKQSIAISGITLGYVITKCHLELLAALRRGVSVRMVIAAQDSIHLPFYERYSNAPTKRLPSIVHSYNTFSKKLQPDERQRLKVAGTKAPIAHSIGIYDNVIYLSQLCLDVDSSNATSYCIEAHMTAHSILLQEMETLINESCDLLA